MLPFNEKVPHDKVLVVVVIGGVRVVGKRSAFSALGLLSADDSEELATEVVNEYWIIVNQQPQEPCFMPEKHEDLRSVLRVLDARFGSVGISVEIPARFIPKYVKAFID